MTPKKRPRVSLEQDSARLCSLIKSARIKRDLSIEEVANYLEIEPKELKAYEGGEAQIPLQDLYALSNCLGIQPTELLEILRKKS